MNVVASRLFCGMAISKMPVRADMSTGTVILVHCFAAAEPARMANAKALCAYIVTGHRVVDAKAQGSMPLPKKMVETQIPRSGAAFDGSCKRWHSSSSAKSYCSHHVMTRAGGSAIGAYVTVRCQGSSLARILMYRERGRACWLHYDWPSLGTRQVAETYD